MRRTTKVFLTAGSIIVLSGAGMALWGIGALYKSYNESALRERNERLKMQEIPLRLGTDPFSPNLGDIDGDSDLDYVFYLVDRETENLRGYKAINDGKGNYDISIIERKKDE